MMASIEALNLSHLEKKVKVVQFDYDEVFFELKDPGALELAGALHWGNA